MRASGTGPASSLVKSHVEQGSSSGCSVRLSLPTSGAVYGLTSGAGDGLAALSAGDMPIDRIAEKWVET